MASLTQWTWVWASSGSWWWTGRLVCCSPWGRRVGHDLLAEQQLSGTNPDPFQQKHGFRNLLARGEWNVSTSCGVGLMVRRSWETSEMKSSLPVGYFPLVSAGKHFLSETTQKDRWCLRSRPVKQAFTVHGTVQARILEWVAILFSRRSSWPRDQTRVSYVSCIAGMFFTTEPLRKPRMLVELGSINRSPICRHRYCFLSAPWCVPTGDGRIGSKNHLAGWESRDHIS